MKINTTSVLKYINGKELEISKDEKLTFGKALAEILVNSKTQGKMKAYTLATKLYENDSVEVDASDLAIIKEAVKTTDRFNIAVTGQCEQLLEEVKETK